jgi:hypothetical protein
MTYDPTAAEAADAAQMASALKKVAGRARAVQPRTSAGPLAGSFTVAALRISGEALSRPIQVANMTLEPAPERPGQSPALLTTMSIPAGGPAPLAVTARIALSNFELGVHGTAALPRLREFAHVTGSPAEQVLAQLAGDPATLEFTAQGPWVPPPDTRLALSPANGPAPPPRSIQTNGTIGLKNANWKADFLANAVMISSATLHMDNGGLRWDPVEFSYGPVKGTATLELPEKCAEPEVCPPKFTIRFGDVDAAAVQAALLGAREKGTLLSSLLNRIKPNSPPAWPQLDGTVTADSLVLGPVTLTKVTAAVKIAPTGAEVPSFDAGLLGGTLSGKVTLLAGDKPNYQGEASFTKISPAQLGQLAAMNWSGGTVSGGGKLELAGYTDADLGKSAKGALHFEWQHGTISGAGSSTGAGVPPALTRFDRWSGDATVADGGLTLQQTEAQRGSRKTPMDATITFGTPAKVTFGTQAKPPSPEAAKAPHSQIRSG